jgi:hypothetical protein
MEAHRSRTNIGAPSLTGTAARCQVPESSKRTIIR